MLQMGTNLAMARRQHILRPFTEITIQKNRLMSYWWTHQPLLHAGIRPPVSPLLSQITTLEKSEDIEHDDFVSTISYSTIESRNDEMNFASLWYHHLQYLAP